MSLGNLSPASVVPGTVLPAALALSFSLTSSYPLLSVDYHDGTVERSLITDTVNPPRPMRIWKLSRRLPPSALATLLTFWEVTVQGGLFPFYFYDPYGVSPGAQIGSNYDPTGNSTQGRVTCYFRGNWTQQITMGTRNDVLDLELHEVA